MGSGLGLGRRQTALRSPRGLVILLGALLISLGLHALV